MAQNMGGRLLVGINDLHTISPEIAEEWHPDLNGDLTPEHICNSSNKIVWWLGKVCGHTWRAQINNRTRRGDGCRICSGRELLSGFNDLQTRSPTVAADWHPTFNVGLTPEDVYYYSKQKVWWLGRNCGHEWDATINNRTRHDSGCPVCAGTQVLAGFNDLKTTHSKIAGEWHPTLNELTPEQISSGSNKTVWWLGENCRHEWQAQVSNRTSRGDGCTECVFYTTSREEIRLRCELEAAGFPIDEITKISVPGRRRKYNCDIVCWAGRLIVEFDSNYYHRGAASIDRDTRKTNALTAIGKTVIRVRDGLPLLFDNDVSLPIGAPALDRAKAVVRKAEKLGFPAPLYNEYLASNLPLGDDVARAIIQGQELSQGCHVSSNPATIIHRS